MCCTPTPVTDLIWLPGEMNNYSQLTTHPMQWGIGWQPQSDWTVISYMLSAFKPFTVTSVTGCSWKLISQEAPSQKHFIKSAWTQEELMCGSDYRKGISEGFLTLGCKFHVQTSLIFYPGILLQPWYPASTEAVHWGTNLHSTHEQSPGRRQCR